MRSAAVTTYLPISTIIFAWRPPVSNPSMHLPRQASTEDKVKLPFYFILLPHHL